MYTLRQFGKVSRVFGLCHEISSSSPYQNIISNQQTKTEKKQQFDRDIIWKTTRYHTIIYIFQKQNGAQ